MSGFFHFFPYFFVHTSVKTPQARFLDSNTAQPPLQKKILNARYGKPCRVLKSEARF